MTVWIETVDSYHSTWHEDREVYHDGHWLCSEGGKILARDLAYGKGDGHRPRCDVCKNSPNLAKAVVREVNEVRERRAK
jgi:hypothetical protein